MSAGSVRDEVARQYREWVYPEPIDDLEAWSAAGHVYADDPSIRQWAAWPRTGLPADAEILVAGCGTIQAASIAYNNPGARVLGIDLSQTSLDATLALKRRHGLDNLEVRELPLQDVASLARRFHQISSTGVLHHLEDPAAGLAALRDILHREGVLALILYGRYARAGVYLMQDLFRSLGVQRDAQGVATVKATLDLLAPRHPASIYRTVATDLDSDAGYVDTFLHPCDRAYTVPEVLALLRGASVAFMGWNEPFNYHPDGILTPDQPLYRALMDLDEEALWSALELLRGDLATHSFLGCRADRPRSSYRVDLDSDELPDMIPVPQPTALGPGDPGSGVSAHIVRNPFPPIPLTEPQTRVWQQFDGERTLREALDAAGAVGDDASKLGFGRNFLHSLLRLGTIHIRLPAKA